MFIYIQKNIWQKNKAVEYKPSKGAQINHIISYENTGYASVMVPQIMHNDHKSKVYMFYELALYICFFFLLLKSMLKLRFMNCETSRCIYHLTPLLTLTWRALIWITSHAHFVYDDVWTFYNEKGLVCQIANDDGHDGHHWYDD